MFERDFVVKWSETEKCFFFFSRGLADEGLRLGSLCFKMRIIIEVYYGNIDILVGKIVLVF